jgi:hypothetical protein
VAGRGEQEDSEKGQAATGAECGDGGCGLLLEVAVEQVGGNDGAQSKQNVKDRDGLDVAKVLHGNIQVADLQGRKGVQG